jgi:two-component system sensor histidine kinase MprB
MTIRTRVTLVAAACIAAAVTVAAVVLYLAEESDLNARVDADLEDRAAEIVEELLAGGTPASALRPPFGEDTVYAQIVTASGEITRLDPETPEIAADDQAVAVAMGDEEAHLTSGETDGVHLRILTVPFEPGSALQVARPLEDIDVHVVRMTGLLTAVIACGLAVAYLLGRLVARAALAPVARLTETAERVAATRDPAHRIEIGGDPELSRLSTAMNDMLAALDESLQAQRRLVADASHELQTPLTSLKTDIEVLSAADGLSADEVRALADDLVDQVDDLSLLATNLVDLARDGPRPVDWQPVDLDEVVAAGALWARKMHPDVDVRLESKPVTIRCDRDGLVRLVRNLLDNACRWNAPDRPVEVTIDVKGLFVRDHGPGLEPDDIPRLFQRFHRSTRSRGERGAGLGLAIVEKVAREHGWPVSARNHPSGGACFEVSFAAEPPMCRDGAAQRSSPGPNGRASQPPSVRDSPAPSMTSQ